MSQFFLLLGAFTPFTRTDTVYLTLPKHSVGGKAIPLPHQLQIVQYPEDENVYLLYCDSKGEVITDTFHENTQDAISQAAWEFNVQEIEWEDFPP